MRRIGTALVALAALGSVAACSGSDAARSYARVVNPMTYARFAAQTAGQMASFVGNTTSTSPAEGQGRGTQVEYFAADGDAYRVTPGSSAVQEGRWQIRETPGQGSGQQICSRYPLSGHPGVAVMQSDSWHCVDAAQWAQDHREVRTGDPLGLETAKAVPEPLPRSSDFTISDGMDLWHREATLAPNKATWTATP